MMIPICANRSLIGASSFCLSVNEEHGIIGTGMVWASTAEAGSVMLVSPKSTGSRRTFEDRRKQEKGAEADAGTATRRPCPDGRRRILHTSDRAARTGLVAGRAGGDQRSARREPAVAGRTRSGERAH